MTQLKPNDVDFVIFHKNCNDGFGSAFAVWKLLGDKPTYHGGIFNTDPPDVTGKNVVLCDFSYKYDVIISMISKANSLLVIDHHIGNKDSLEKLDDKYKIFDMNKSGAMLTWEYFHPNTPPPLFIKYIEDRDIWRKALPYSDEFFAKFKSVPHEFTEYDKFMDEKNVQECINEGKVLLEYDRNMIDRSLKHAVCKFCKLPDDKYYLIAFLESTVLKSELGNILCTEIFPECDFAAIYSFDDSETVGITNYSLRSLKNKTDVRRIAELFGGSGHAAASGCSFYGPTCKSDFGIVLSKNVYDLIQTADTYYLNQLKIVGFNSSNLRTEIGWYLLCNKYKDCDIAAGWNYDMKNKTTIFNILFNIKLSQEVKNKFIVDFKGEVKGYTTIVKLDGLHDKIS